MPRRVTEARFKRPAHLEEAERNGDPYPRRFTVALSEEQYRAVRGAAMADGIGANERIRALLALWQEDPTLRARVLERASS